MALKRKTRKAPKVSLEPQQEKKSQSKPAKTAAELIRENGTLVENLLTSEVWKEIIDPLFEESIAGVSGRKTNGRYHHGTLTRDWKENTSVFLAGYQKGLMDLYNNIQDFVAAKKKLEDQVKAEKRDAQAPLENPFLEELDEK